MYNQMSIVSLDQPGNTYNHTELALPVAPPSNLSSSFEPERCKSEIEQASSSSRRGGNRRAQRGDLKQVKRVATMANDGSHVLLELDDVSTVDGIPTSCNSYQPEYAVYGPVWFMRARFNRLCGFCRRMGGVLDLIDQCAQAFSKAFGLLVAVLSGRRIRFHEILSAQNPPELINFKIESDDR